MWGSAIENRLQGCKRCAYEKAACMRVQINVILRWVVTKGVPVQKA